LLGSGYEDIGYGRSPDRSAGRPHEQLTPQPAKQSHLALRKHISAPTPPFRDLRHALDSWFFVLSADALRLGRGAEAATLRENHTTFYTGHRLASFNFNLTRIIASNAEKENRD